MGTPGAVGDLVVALAWPDRLPPRYADRAERAFRRLLRHAAATVPWYGRLCREAGIDPARAGLEALTRLPVTRKADWQAHPPSEFHSRAVDIAGCRTMPTGGTTGAPHWVPYVAADHRSRRVGFQRAFSAAGVGVRDRYAWIQVAPERPRSRRLHERLGFLRILYLDRFARPETYWRTLQDWRPRGLLGFPLEMEALAGRVGVRHLPPLPSPVLCAITGEPVEPETRRRIEAALGPVRELYGSAEGGTVAWDCGAGSALHINADMVVVEFLVDGRPAQPGTPGEIVLTNLRSWALPVIRYGQGDVGCEIPGPCPCGRPGPLMRVAPRFRVGPFQLPSGRRLSGRFFAHALGSPDWLVGWAADQPAPDSLRLVLTTRRAVPSAELRAIVEILTRGCWEPVRVEVECRIDPG